MKTQDAVSFGRSCQSPRTGFIHLFAGDAGGDTIPLYENFCFAIALIRQKTAEGIYEGKDLLERLYAFQAGEGFAWAGNFSIYLHDFPRCWNPFQPLRIAPLLIQLLREFKPVLGAEFCLQTTQVLERLLACIAKRREEKPFEPLWDKRARALLGLPIVPTPTPLSSENWAEELITLQLLGSSTEAIARLIHPTLGYCGPSGTESQEKYTPMPTSLDAKIGEKPHPALLQQAALLAQEDAQPPLPWRGALENWQMSQEIDSALSYAKSSPEGSDTIALRLLWGKNHSLAIPTNGSRVEIEEKEGELQLVFDLVQEVAQDRHDLVEVALYCNLSLETRVTIEGQRGTAFSIDQTVWIATPTKKIEARFSLLEGEGEFFGHISRSNRLFQKACKGALTYEAFDWKIGLRTLRRSQRAKVLVCLKDY